MQSIKFMNRSTLHETFKLWNAAVQGRRIETVDRSALYQCVDLVVDWLDRLGIPRLSNGSSIFNHVHAYQIWTVQTDIKKKYFEFLENTPDFVPEPGDIVVWKQSYNNGSGHTAVATGKGNKSTFEATSQNDPTGRETHTRTYTYAHIAGFLRYKTDQDQVTPYVSTQTSYQQLRQTWRELYDGEELSVSAIKKQKAERDGLYQNYQKALKDNERLSTIMSDNKTKSDQRIASLEKDISRLQNELLNAREQYTACKTALKKKHEEVDIEKEIAPFRTRIVELENKLKEAEENAREWEKMYHEKPAHVIPVRPEPKNMVASFFYILFEFFNK